MRDSHQGVPEHEEVPDDKGHREAALHYNHEGNPRDQLSGGPRQERSAIHAD